ncbi:Septum formation protein Maf [hydrothermal vent metagenome]|uniref:Septum formation protein Maf n=1 Tax=hydrothermal vent metagenome TaxID=652676 RepID=A0A3B0V209_9ZZZZ
MTTETFKIILGSASPRRRELLEKITEDFTVVSADIDESPLEGEAPLDYTLRLAHSKAVKVCEIMARRALKPEEDEKGPFIIIGADTTVELGGTLYGKPATREEAAGMLRKLSNNTHSVVTAFAVLDTATDKCLIRAVRSLVTMRELGDEEISEYVATGECDDKAGAYAIQGGAAGFIDTIQGSYSNIVGLPVEELSAALKDIRRPQALPFTEN